MPKSQDNNEKTHKTIPVSLKSTNIIGQNANTNKEKEALKNESIKLIIETKPVLHGSDSIYTSMTTIRTTSITLPTPEAVMHAGCVLDSERMFFGIEEADVEVAELQDEDEDDDNDDNEGCYDEDNEDNEGCYNDDNEECYNDDDNDEDNEGCNNDDNEGC